MTVPRRARSTVQVLILALAAASSCGRESVGSDGSKDAGSGGSRADANAGSGGTTEGTGGGSATGGATGSGGVIGSGGTAASGGAIGSGGTLADAMTMMDASGSGGTVAGGNDITKVAPTAGCGMAPAVTGRQAITTMGTKPAGCADSKCGAWMYDREYFVTLPQGYVNTKAYPLVFEAPGCASSGAVVYPLNNGVNDTVIRVGLTPPPNDIGHPTNPNQNCFDDREGDDSVDLVLYENLWDRLASQFCFDKNRVFSVGNSSGSSFSNEVACKYAGNAARPIRAPLPNNGSLPTQPMWTPTCTNKPMAGMWVEDAGGILANNKSAIARAMMVNKCTIGTTVDNTMFDNYPIGGGNPDGTCKKIRGCPDLYPLVVCELTGATGPSHDSVVNPGFSTFISMFSMAPFLTP